MNIGLNATGVEGLGEIAWGTHFCLFYETRQDLLDFFVPYLRAGLENNEFCLCIASEPLIAKEALRAMRVTIPNFERYLTGGQIEIVSHTDRYFKDGHFNPGRVRQEWTEKIDQALAKGYAGMRFASNLAMLKTIEWGSFAEFEEALEKTFRNLQIEGVCAYRLDCCSAADALDVVHRHQFTIVRREGFWEALEGPELQRAHEKIRELNRDLERRVAERTAQLSTANQRLREEITERKRVEEALKESNIRLEVALESAQIGTGEWDIQADRVSMSEGLRKIFGFPPDKVVARLADLEERIPPEDRQPYREQVEKALTGETDFGMDYRVVWPNGKIRWVTARARIVYDSKGKPTQLVGAAIDITDRKLAEESLHESQQLLQLVLATLPVGVSVMDREGNIILMNDISKRIWDGKIISGRERWTQTRGFWHDTGNQIAPAEWASVRALSEGQTRLNELIDVETYGGQRKTILNSAAPIRNVKELIVGAVVVNEDVTDRVRAEEVIKLQAARAETLARIAARLNRQLDLEAVVFAVCQEIVDTFKVSQAVMNLYDQDSDRLVYAGGINIPPEYAAIMEPIPREQFDEFLRAMGPIMVVPDIQALPDVPIAEFSFHFDVRTVVTAAMLRDEELIGVVALGVNGRIREFTQDELTLLQAISDLAAQALANAKLLKAANEQHDQLRALSTRLVETQETERRAIARELHDEVGQTLTALKINLGLIRDEVLQTDSGLGEGMEKAISITDETIERMHSLAVALRPPALDEVGLSLTLEALCQAHARLTHLEIDYQADEIPALTDEASISLYRFLQEALTNVSKHAQASQVWVRFRLEEGFITLSVQDNGLGFDAQAAASPGSVGIGLVGMKERLESWGGYLEIETQPGSGSRLVAHVPLSKVTLREKNP